MKNKSEKKIVIVRGEHILKWNHLPSFELKHLPKLCGAVS